MHRPLNRSIPLLTFDGQIIAIDALLWAYTHMSVANKVVTGYTDVGVKDVDRQAVIQKWLTSALDTVCMFLSHGVTPVFVFDGEHIPDKAKTQSKRKEVKLQNRNEIELIKAELKTMSPLEHSADMLNRLRKLLPRDNYISTDEISQLKELLTGIGVPILQAVGEAEQLCSAMAKEGLVSAVFSRDTDPLAWGCPLVITEMGDYYQKEGQSRKYRNVTCVYLPDILDDLQWSQGKFVDLCITLGCDFNQRIKGLGPKTAYNLLEKYGSIDNFPPNYDLTPLRHERCRDIFAHRSPIHVVEGDELPVTRDGIQLDRHTFFSQGEDYLSKYSLNEYFGRIRYLYSLVPQESTGKIPSFPHRTVITIRRKA